MTLNPSNSSNLEQPALKGLTVFFRKRQKTSLFRDASSAVLTRSQAPVYLRILRSYINQFKL